MKNKAKQIQKDIRNSIVDLGAIEGSDIEIAEFLQTIESKLYEAQQILGYVIELEEK